MSAMLQRLLRERAWLIADGAMGTSLFARGLDPGMAPERWLIERPDAVRAVHRDFIGADADILLTNTFGANRARLERLGLGARAGELNGIAVALARDAAKGAGRNIVIAGSVGPTGDGAGGGAIDHGEVFAEQMAALKTAGADVAWIETMYRNNECRAAVRAAIEADMPYVVTATFGGDGRMADGVDVQTFTRALAAVSPPPIAIGVNCGEGPDQVVEAVAAMARAAPEAVIVAKANKGLPRVVDGRLVYSQHDMAGYARQARHAGARIIGGCCGTTAEDIAAMLTALSTQR